MFSLRDLVLVTSERSSFSVLSRDNLREERGQWAGGTGKPCLLRGHQTRPTAGQSWKQGGATVMAFTTLRVSARFLQSPFLPRDTLVQREKAVTLSLLGSLVKLSIKCLNTFGQEALQNKSQQDLDTPPLLWHEYKSSNSRKARRCRHSGQ